MKDNAVEIWVNTDKKLQNLIMEIESTGKTLTEKAELGFERLCELYQIPRMPTDKTNENLDESVSNDYDRFERSLFEEHAYIKFLSDGTDDPRGLVLSAAYHLLNGLEIDLGYIVKKAFGKKKECLVALRGDGYHGEVVFPEKEGKSWVELGCVMQTLYLNK
ncbi:MAG: hypothetical protein IPJ13_20080 [Saprospiraceae bacterium]|nr:hypothetical protein [Saprospiraceae bacterium]